MLRFREFAANAAEKSGSTSVFLPSCAVIVLWGATGPLFNYSDTWQLIINTFTSVVTFLMVFLIQNTQNREAKATQLKLNELIRAVGDARESMMDLENCTDEELAEIREEFASIRRRVVEQRSARTVANSSRSN